jgi:hypothetical protein
MSEVRTTQLRPAIVLVAAAALAAIGISGLAVASIPDAGGVIHGCYDKATGALRVIDSDAKQVCQDGENAINWQQFGVTGINAGNGLAGGGGPGDVNLDVNYGEVQARVAGRCRNGAIWRITENGGADCSGPEVVMGQRTLPEGTSGDLRGGRVIARLRVPAGAHLVQARVQIQGYGSPSTNPSALHAVVACRLEAGGASDRTLSTVRLGGYWVMEVPLAVSATLRSAGPAVLSCESEGDAYAIWHKARMWATSVFAEENVSIDP